MLRHDRRAGLVFALLAVSSAASAQGPAVGVDLPPASAATRTEDERNYLLRRQQDIFRINVETDYALALQRLCQTGYGDPHLCQQTVSKPIAAPSIALPEANRKEYKDAAIPRRAAGRYEPSVREILGIGDSLSALLTYPDGRTLNVHGPEQGVPGSVLPDGRQVVAVEARRVMVKSAASGVVSLPLDADGAGFREDGGASADQ